jgi:hypothetical protein
VPLGEYRKAGAMCLFGGHISQYTADKDGGCPPPAGHINVKDCAAEAKPNFKCNNLGLTSGATPTSVCVGIQPVASLTQRCVEKFKDVLFKNAEKLKLDAAKFEELRKSVMDLLQKYLASKGKDPNMTIAKYCAKPDAGAAQELNVVNKNRQKLECKNLFEVRDIAANAGTWKTFADSNRQAPARR